MPTGKNKTAPERPLATRDSCDTADRLHRCDPDRVRDMATRRDTRCVIEQGHSRRLVALVVALILTLLGCGTRKDNNITDWCLIRVTTGPSFGMYSGGTRSECRVKSWGLWRRLDEVAVGGAYALDADTVLIALPGERKLIRRGERRAMAPCPGAVVQLPNDHSVLDCVSYVAGRAPGVPTELSVRRLTIYGEELEQWKISALDPPPPAVSGGARDVSTDERPEDETSVAPLMVTDAPSATTSSATEHAAAHADGASPASATGAPVIAKPVIAKPTVKTSATAALRVFAGPVISYYDESHQPYFVTFLDSSFAQPECVLIGREAGVVRRHPAPPGTPISECSEPSLWSTVVGRPLHHPE